jgi:hypothetical protein
MHAHRQVSSVAVVKLVEEPNPAATRDCLQRPFQGHLSSKRKKRSPAFIADVASDIENDRLMTVKKLALAYAVSKRGRSFSLYIMTSFSPRSLRDGS